MTDEPFPFPDEDPTDPIVKMYMDAWARMNAEQRKYFRDTWSKGDSRHTRICHWISQLVELAKAVNDNGKDTTWQVRELFWIRLYGVMTELSGAVRPVAEAVRYTPHDPVALAAVRLSELAAEMKAALTRDEAVTLDWLRQRSAHLVQNGFGVRLDLSDPSAVAEDRQTVKLVGASIAITEINATINRILADHDGDAGFLVVLVNRLQPPLLELYDAMRAYQGG